jgi:hypothetical protein
MTNEDRFSQASTLGGDALDPDVTLSSRRYSNPQHSTPSRNSVNSHRTDNVSRSTVAPRTRHAPDRRPPQASDPTIMNRRTTLQRTYVPATVLPVSLTLIRGEPEPILKPRIHQTDAKQDNRRAAVYWKPPTDSSTKHD